MSKKILLVEDEAIIAMSESQMLKKNGYEVATVSSGEKALTAVDSDPDISLILMDIDLGKGMDGTETAEAILKKKDIPVIFLSSHTEPEVVEKTEKITSYGYVVKNSGATVLDTSIKMAFRLFDAKMREKEHKEVLRKSEATIRKRLKAITEQEGDIGALELGDIISVEDLQLLMEDAFKVSKVGGAILDGSGKILVCTTMEDICRKFHRVHPDTVKNCIESDMALGSSVPKGTFKAYQCKNNMWDMVTPLEIGGKHLGNIYIGQFFFADEDVDYELFRKHARQYGFDETAYIEALDRVPRLTRETVERAMSFYSRLADMISSLSYTAIKLSRQLVQQEQTEKNLMYQNTLLESIISGTSDIFAILNTDLTIERYNEAGYKRIGKTPDEVKGKKCYKLMGYENECDGCPTKRALMSKKLEHLEKYFPSMDIFLDCRSSPVLDKDGNVIKIVEHLRDITGQKKLVHQLNEKNDLLQNITDNMFELVALTDVSGNYTFIGKSHSALGYDTNALLCKNVLELVHPEDSTRIKAYFKKILQSNETEGKNEFRYRCADGSYIWVETAGKKIFGEDGEIKELLFSSRDITDRKQAEDALKAKNILLEKIFDNNIDLIALTDLEGNFRMVSNAHGILGYEIESLIGKNVMDFVHPEDVSFIAREFSEFLQSGGTRRAEYRNRRIDGEYLWFETTGTILKDNNGIPEQILFNTRDISDRKAQETKIKKSEERFKTIFDNSKVSLWEEDISELRALIERHKKEGITDFNHYFDNNPEAVWTLAKKFNVIDINDAALKLYGAKTKEELLGSLDKTLYLADDSCYNVFKNELIAIAEKKTSVNGEMKTRTFHGTVLDVSMNMYISMEKDIVIVAINDITPYKKALAEKDFLMKELNHRVKNNLFMVSSLIKLKNLETEIDLSDIQHKIEGIGLIHERLYQTGNVTEINCRNYISDLLSSIFSSFTRRNVKVEADIVDFCVSTKTAMPLGLIINEIATNAIKHGFNEKEEARFPIQLKEDQKNRRYELTVSNSGNPFPAEIDIDNPDTLGLRLISALVDQIDGTIELKKSPSPVFTIRFPIDKV